MAVPEREHRRDQRRGETRYRLAAALLRTMAATLAVKEIPRRVVAEGQHVTARASTPWPPPAVHFRHGDRAHAGLRTEVVVCHAAGMVDAEQIDAKIAAERARVVGALRRLADRLESMPTARVTTALVFVAGVVESLERAMERAFGRESKPNG
jgi:hypothetical protein